MHVPTLVIHRTQDPVVNVEGGRLLAKNIPNARLLEVPGIDHLPYLGDDSDQLTDEVAEFLTGVKPTISAEHILATVLLTDIVNSTKHAEAMGDRRWRAASRCPQRDIPPGVDPLRGVEVKTTGDGFLATFDGPDERFIAHFHLSRDVPVLYLRTAQDFNWGEVEVGKNDLRGIAVHVAARVAAQAKACECLVTRTVKDLVAGADIRFTECGKRDLKGFAEPVDLFAVAPTQAAPTR